MIAHQLGELSTYVAYVNADLSARFGYVNATADPSASFGAKSAPNFAQDDRQKVG
jgi:hypothetical protein